MYYIKGHGWVEIHRSARKHGISDHDMCHAVAQAMVVLGVTPGPQGRSLHLGADSTGRLLEVVSVGRASGRRLIIHAMPMRRKFRTYLSEG